MVSWGLLRGRTSRMLQKKKYFFSIWIGETAVIKRVKIGQKVRFVISYISRIWNWSSNVVPFKESSQDLKPLMANPRETKRILFIKDSWSVTVTIVPKYLVYDEK